MRSMEKAREEIWLVKVGIVGILALGYSALVLASTVGVTYSTAQDTFIRAVLIPLENLERCKAHSLPGGCSQAQVVEAGCSASPLALLSKRNPTFRSCTIYTQNAAGQASLTEDLVAEALMTRVQRLRSADSQDGCAAFGGASDTAQDAACAAVGLPAGCTFCR